MVEFADFCADKRNCKQDGQQDNSQDQKRRLIPPGLNIPSDSSQWPSEDTTLPQEVSRPKRG